MLFTQNQKILLFVLLLILLILILCRFKKNEYMQNNLSNIPNINSIIFYKLLCKSLNIINIPNEVNLNNIPNEINSNNILIKSKNLNNYLYISDNILYLYKIDTNSFVIDKNFISTKNGKLYILNTDSDVYPYKILSIDDDHENTIILHDLTSTNSIKVTLQNTEDNISKDDLVILIHNIQQSTLNYLSLLSKEFKIINMNNHTNYTQIMSQKNIVLNGLILISENLMHYLFVDNSGLYKISLNSENNDLKLDILQIRIKDSEKIIFTSEGNLLSYNDKNNLIYTLVRESNKNITTLKLSNTGKLIFTDKTNNIYNSIDLDELKQTINIKLVLSDLQSFNQKANSIFNSVNKINFTLNNPLLNIKQQKLDNIIIKPDIKLPKIYNIINNMQ